MICLDCNNTEFKTVKAPILQEFHGEKFEVVTSAEECTMCGYKTVTFEQADELRKNTVDAYRLKQNLLTGKEILAIRNSLDLSQIEFARFLHVGVASVKRWETGTIVQSKALDELIRLKYKSLQNI